MRSASKKSERRERDMRIELVRRGFGLEAVRVETKRGRREWSVWKVIGALSCVALVEFAALVTELQILGI